MSDSSKLNVAMAASLAESIRLKGVEFLNIVAEHLGSWDSGKLHFDVPEVTATWLRVDRDIRAIFPFIVEISSLRDDNHRTPLGIIKTTIRLEYKIKADCAIPSNEDLRHYVGISGYMHSWPYLRAEVQSLSAKIGFPALLLPVIVSGHAASRVVVKQVQPAPSLVASRTRRTTPSVPEKRAKRS